MWDLYNFPAKLCKCLLRSFNIFVKSIETKTTTSYFNRPKQFSSCCLGLFVFKIFDMGYI
jgi:hypothetical protein